METLLKYLTPENLALVYKLVQEAIAAAEQKGELTPEAAQLHRDNIENIWAQEYARTDAERGKA